jgi:peroxiredoxin
MSSIVPGQAAPRLAATTITGRAVQVPDPSARFVHLQFRRFAGCPVCNFHLMGFARRHAEIRAAGIREVVLFHSSAGEMLQYQAQLPFDCIADPGMAHYRAYGVQASWRALLHPRVLVNGARWVATARRFYRRAENGILGLPADFLVDAQGTVQAMKYGAHADDQWEVDELLQLASSTGNARHAAAELKAAP